MQQKHQHHAHMDNTTPSFHSCRSSNSDRPACMRPVSLLLLLLTILLHIHDFAPLCSSPAETACCELQAAGGLHAGWDTADSSGWCLALTLPGRLGLRDRRCVHAHHATSAAEGDVAVLNDALRHRSRCGALPPNCAAELLCCLS